jgi:UDP-N-acetyl-D-galactosamine dehydrogenase
VTILGLTFKENIPDIRNSKVMDIIRELQGFRIPIQAHDPIADPGDAQSEYGIELLPRHALQPGQAVILAVPHHCFVDEGWSLVTSLLKNAKGAVLDVKAKPQALTFGDFEVFCSTLFERFVCPRPAGFVCRYY